MNALVPREINQCRICGGIPGSQVGEPSRFVVPDVERPTGICRNCAENVIGWEAFFLTGQMQGG